MAKRLRCGMTKPLRCHAAAFLSVISTFKLALMVTLDNI